jgi:hypothetical protein
MWRARLLSQGTSGWLFGKYKFPGPAPGEGAVLLPGEEGAGTIGPERSPHLRPRA